MPVPSRVLQALRRAVIAGGALLGAAIPGGTLAASLQVSPTMIELGPDEPAAGLWISNSGNAPLQVQIRLFRWTQHDGAEDLQPSDDLLLSPPMQTLAVGQRQLIRIVRGDPSPPATQTSYRIIVDELPPPATDRSGMQFVLRYSMPVFVNPADGGGAPRLQSRLLDTPQGAVLEVHNAGNRHAQLADIARGPTQTPQIIRPGLLGYALAGQTMRWTLQPPGHSLQGATLSARINGESHHTPLPTAPPAR